jgi:predicted nucleotidyltransferase component of viral defense system
LSKVFLEILEAVRGPGFYGCERNQQKEIESMLKNVLNLLNEKTGMNFYDSIGFTILVYSMDEILQEKLRSIIQRGKSRDYFDVWMLLNKNKFDKAKIKDIFMEKCKFKNINLSKCCIYT